MIRKIMILNSDILIQIAAKKRQAEEGYPGGHLPEDFYSVNGSILTDDSDRWSYNLDIVPGSHVRYGHGLPRFPIEGWFSDMHIVARAFGVYTVGVFLLDTRGATWSWDATFRRSADRTTDSGYIVWDCVDLGDLHLFKR